MYVLRLRAFLSNCLPSSLGRVEEVRVNLMLESRVARKWRLSCTCQDYQKPASLKCEVGSSTVAATDAYPKLVASPIVGIYLA